MGKPTGVLHRDERKRSLMSHAADYVRYKKGELEYEIIQGEVEELRDQGVTMDEIVKARAKALKGAKML